MKNVTKIVNKTLSYFRSGYNCAESVLLAIAKDALEIDNDLIPKIATGFGGGMSRQGYVCGAVSGAVIGFGLKYGRNSPEELRAKTYNRVVEFYKQFQKRFGSIVCKELCGCDLSTIEGIRKFREEDVHEEKCSNFVSGAIEIFMGLIDETKLRQTKV
ncbi:MAG: C-GCAxxG-C-C family protein [Candidatus Bathyarchaeota archaeon]|nr:C-GCAxxG-C-C family protein [Candidatus Bathyarchaeota archaeon]